MCNKKIGHTKIRQKDNTCFNKPPSIYPSLDSLILNYQIWHVFFSPMSRPNLKLYQPYPFDCTWTFLKWCLKLDGIQSLTLLKVCLKRLGETTKWMHSTSVFLGDQFKIISIYIYPKGSMGMRYLPTHEMWMFIGNQGKYTKINLVRQKIKSEVPGAPRYLPNPPRSFNTLS